MSPQTKRCSRCALDKTLDHFTLRMKKSSGYMATCEECAAYKRAYHIANKSKICAVVKRWREANPERCKAYGEKSFWRTTAEGRALIAEASREWRKNHPEASREHYAANRQTAIAKAREWQRENPERVCANASNYRARKQASSGTLSKDIIHVLIERQRGKCVCCKVDLSNQNCHLDHIYPLSRGGNNTDENCQLLCRSCNISKGAKDPITFMQSRGFLL